MISKGWLPYQSQLHVLSEVGSRKCENAGQSEYVSGETDNSNPVCELEDCDTMLVVSQSTLTSH